MSQESTDRLVVTTDRVGLGRRVRRSTWILTAVMLAAVLVGATCMVASSTMIDATVPLTMVWTIALMVGLLGFMAAFVGTFFGTARLMVLREVPTIVAVDREGLWLAVPGSDAGFAWLPWSAVGTVEQSGRRSRGVLVVRLRPGLRPDHPGVQGLAEPLVWRVARQNGFKVDLSSASHDAATVLAAINHHAASSAAVPAPRSA